MIDPSRERPALALLQLLVEERVGIHYGANDEEIFHEKVASRALEAGFDSLLDYYYLLRYDDPGRAELARLLDAITVNESYLFREQDQLDFIASEIVPVIAASGRRARVWSAACARGEEPFTLAMILADAGLLDSVELVASDVSEGVLERARTGAVSKWALRAAPPRSQKWLTEKDGQVFVADALRAAVRFERINLMEPDAVCGLGPVDVVLCRNVFIYFREETITRIVRSITEALLPGGALFVGVSESLLRFSTDLECIEKRGVFFYRKP